MRSLGLVRDHRTDPSRAVATVLLYPTESLYIASDCGGGAGRSAPRDGGISCTPRSRRTRGRSWGRCRARRVRVSGSLRRHRRGGLAAAASFADNAWAIDVADRSTDFARFNARLNGLSNVTAVSGDLYAPVAGLTFDRIVAHPPYVPSRETTMVYRDGGATGRA
jgi:hypothetical protein